MTFSWVLCPAPGSASCLRCCGICWGRAGEKQQLRVSSASCFPLSSSGQRIPSERNALRSLLPVLAAGIPSGEHIAFTTCSRNDLALAGPGVGAQTLSLVARHFPVLSPGSSASRPSSSAQSFSASLFFFFHLYLQTEVFCSPCVPGRKVKGNHSPHSSLFKPIPCAAPEVQECNCPAAGDLGI